MSLDDRVGSSRSRLDDVTYDLAAGDFVRYRPDDRDDTVAGIVRTVAAEGWAGCNEFRAGLSVESTETLRLFAERRTLLGRRQSSMSPLYEALDAFALLPTPEDVPWDSWVKACLFVARSNGGDPDMIDRRFDDVADEDLVARWRVALESMNRVEELAQCRMAEVTTTFGVGFVELLAFADRPGRGSRAPFLAKSPPSYAPGSNLAQLAVTLADSLDATGNVTTSPIVQDQLAASLFAMSASGSYLDAAGCLGFEAMGRDGAATFQVYVAELPEDADVADLADAAASVNDQSALYDGQRLIVLSPQPTFEDLEDFDEDEDEEPVDFTWADELAIAALADPATRSS